jgi:hypothetical protein
MSPQCLCTFRPPKEGGIAPNAKISPTLPDSARGGSNEWRAYSWFRSSIVSESSSGPDEAYAGPGHATFVLRPWSSADQIFRRIIEDWQVHDCWNRHLIRLVSPVAEAASLFCLSCIPPGRRAGFDRLLREIYNGRCLIGNESTGSRRIIVLFVKKSAVNSLGLQNLLDLCPA